MPIYAYRCESCGHAKDVLQKMSDPLLTTCPACGAESFKKQLTAAGFQLKGSGWYVTDFRGGSNAAAPESKDKVAPTGTDTAAPVATPSTTPATPASTTSTTPSSGGSSPAGAA
jgi:putative FmdB family regulatory protein